MDWIKISTEDLECAVNKPQLDILKAQALRSPNRDICADIISSIVQRIRAEIAVSGLNGLDPDHARIPPELKECALRLCVEALQLRVPSLELSNMQIKHADIARETLKRIADGELSVSRPIFSISTATRKKGFFAKSAQKNATRDTMEGI